MIYNTGERPQSKLILAVSLLVIFLAQGCGSKDKNDGKLFVSHDFIKNNYRRIYQTVDYWNFETCTTYLQTGGWTEPKKDITGEYGVHAQKRKATLVLYLTEKKDMDVTMRCAPYKPEGSRGKVKIAFNKKPLTAIDIKPGPRTEISAYSFKVPAKYQELGQNSIQLTFLADSLKTPVKKKKK
ncbi:MAG: hypothetical protein GY940_05005, partial [bacterium]|nr:hypothetical protein [bacterium]